MENLIVYSGEVQMGLAGTPTALKTTWNENLFVGDIVAISKDGYSSDLLTCVVADNEGHFIMGIKDCCTKEDYEGWGVLRLKKFSDVIPGEKWPAWGFHYELAQ